MLVKKKIIKPGTGQGEKVWEEFHHLVAGRGHLKDRALKKKENSY